MSQPFAPFSLGYASPLERTENVKLFRGCIVAGVLPSVVGLAILLLYLVTRFDFFVMMGFFWLMIGGIISFAAFCASLVLLIQAFSVTHDKQRAIYRGVLCIFMALANLPVAGFCIAVGSSMVPAILE